MENNQEPKFKKIVNAADDLSLGISIVVAVAIGVGIGFGLKSLFGYQWLFWLGVFWGLAAAFLNVYRAYKKQKASFDELANDPKYNYKALKKDDDDEED